MKLYRILTGPDDASFCHRVSEALSQGWELHGDPALTWDPEQKRVICGQAIVKEVEGQSYSPDMKLSEHSGSQSAATSQTRFRARASGTPTRAPR